MSSAHVETDILRRYALDHVSNTDASDIESHLIECTSCRSSLTRLASQANWLRTERRSEPRARLSGTVRIRVLDLNLPGGRSVSTRAVESSKRGIRVDSPSPIDKGAMVRLRVQDWIVFGEVVWCNPTGDRFHVGIKLLDVF